MVTEKCVPVHALTVIVSTYALLQPAFLSAFDVNPHEWHILTHPEVDITLKTIAYIPRQSRQILNGTNSTAFQLFFFFFFFFPLTGVGVYQSVRCGYGAREATVKDADKQDGVLRYEVSTKGSHIIGRLFFFCLYCVVPVCLL